MDSLSDDIIIGVSYYLPIRDFIFFASTQKRLMKFLDDDRIWMSIYCSYHGGVRRRDVIENTSRKYKTWREHCVDLFTAPCEIEINPSCTEIKKDQKIEVNFRIIPKRPIVNITNIHPTVKVIDLETLMELYSEPNYEYYHIDNLSNNNNKYTFWMSEIVDRLPPYKRVLRSNSMVYFVPPPIWTESVGKRLGVYIEHFGVVSPVLEVIVKDWNVDKMEEIKEWEERVKKLLNTVNQTIEKDGFDYYNNTNQSVSYLLEPVLPYYNRLPWKLQEETSQFTKQHEVKNREAFENVFAKLNSMNKVELEILLKKKPHLRFIVLDKLKTLKLDPHYFNELPDNLTLEEARAVYFNMPNFQPDQEKQTLWILELQQKIEHEIEKQTWEKKEKTVKVHKEKKNYNQNDLLEEILKKRKRKD